MMCNRLFQIYVYEHDTRDVYLSGSVYLSICAGREAEKFTLRA